MLDADGAPEHRLWMKSDVAAAINALSYAQSFVDGDATTVQGQAECFGNLEVRFDPDGEKDHVDLLSPAVRKGHAHNILAFRVPLLDRGPGPHVDAFRAVATGIALAHLVAQRPGERHGRRLDHQHILAQLPCRRADLGADEAGSDEQDARAFLERPADALAVVQRA